MVHCGLFGGENDVIVEVPGGFEVRCVGCETILQDLAYLCRAQAGFSCGSDYGVGVNVMIVLS